MDNLKFMQLSKDAVIDKKNKHKRREEQDRDEEIKYKEKEIINESLPFFFKQVQALAKNNSQSI